MASRERELEMALKPFADLLNRPWIDKAKSIETVRNGGSSVSELQAVNLADVIAAHDLLEN